MTFAQNVLGGRAAQPRVVSSRPPADCSGRTPRPRDSQQRSKTCAVRPGACIGRRLDGPSWVRIPGSWNRGFGELRSPAARGARRPGKPALASTEAAGPSPTSVGACSFPSAEWRERCVAHCRVSRSRRAHPARRWKPFEVRSAVERRAILHRSVMSRRDSGNALYDSGLNNDRQHDRVVVSLDLRLFLEAPGSGKTSPPVPAPTDT